MQKIILSEYNICLLDFFKLLAEYEKYIINDLHVYNLLKDKKINHDVKKLLMHHIIHYTCNTVINLTNNEKPVLFVSPGINLELYSYFNKEQIDTFIVNLTKKLGNMLPLCFYYDDNPFSIFCSKITSAQGFGYESLLKLLSHVQNINTEKFTFSKIKNYAKKNDLTFLTKEFFNSFKTKQHLLV